MAFLRSFLKILHNIYKKSIENDPIRLSVLLSYEKGQFPAN